MATTKEAAAVVRSAGDVARDVCSKVIGQEHVILGIGDRPGTLGAAALSAVGVDPASIRAGLLSMMSPVRTAPASPPEPTPRLRKALEEADAEAAERGRPTTSADLLLGILRSHQGVGFQLLGYAGIDETTLRAAVDDLVAAGHPELTDVEDTPAASAI